MRQMLAPVPFMFIADSIPVRHESTNQKHFSHVCSTSSFHVCNCDDAMCIHLGEWCGCQCK